MKTVRIALLGLGTVAQGTLQILASQGEGIALRSNLRFQVTGILVRDRDRPRPDWTRHYPVTACFEEILDSEPEVLIEAIGNLEPAFSYVSQALKKGISVITANKLMVSSRYGELQRFAAEGGARLLFEASVGGGVPIIRTLQQYLTAEPVTGIAGILNGTTNFILTEMAQRGCGFEQALSKAQSLGYAEADPTSDVAGCDTLFKLLILSELAYGKRLTQDTVYREGIQAVSAADIRLARGMGCAIRLLAYLNRRGDRTEAWVAPVLVPQHHSLASVNGCHNGILVKGPSIGELTLAGPGAGGAATGSAIVADLLALSADVKAPGAIVPPSIPSDACESSAPFYLRLTHHRGIDGSEAARVLDRAGIRGHQEGTIEEVGGVIHRAYRTGLLDRGAVSAALNSLRKENPVYDAAAFRIETFTQSETV